MNGLGIGMEIGLIEEGLVISLEGLGYCNVWNMDGEWRNVYISYVEVFEVGKGNGRILWNIVESVLREIEVECIGLECKEGKIGFWEKMGFKVEGIRSSIGIGMSMEL